MKRNLAESENYIIISDYEMVSLHFKTKARRPICIGDFYGDPDSALISRDEKYVVMAGCGLIIYNLQEPFIEYPEADNTKQFFEFNNKPPNVWWTGNIHQPAEDAADKFFRFTKEEEDLQEVVYRFDTTTHQVDKLDYPYRIPVEKNQRNFFVQWTHLH